MTRMQARMLPDGRRLHLQDGPIDLVIGADGGAADVRQARQAAMSRFATILDELCAELELLRRPVDPCPEGSVARRMWAATRRHARRGFITPMAAVAGSVADEVLAAMTATAPLSRAFVNNGGDIAIHLQSGQCYAIGLVDRPDQPSLFARAGIAAEDGIGGIATSGWRGRSFSLGIADAVTVLADKAGEADAAATVIANAVDLPGHPAITSVPAADLQPDSDLGARPVTRGVGPLRPDEISAALASGLACAAALLKDRHVTACAIHLAGETRTLGTVPLEHDWRLAANA